MITVTDLRKVYRQGKKEVVALDGVSLSVPKGSIHGIIGHSGAGKSTLVRCLTLLDRPTSGSVNIDGTELSSVRDSEIRAARRRIGMVFQHANLMDSRTAAGNVAHPLELVKTPKDKIRAKVAELLKLVGLEGFENAYPSQLSGGQRQRVGIARALASDPDVLLCDEPTSALDPATTDEILDLIQDLTRRLQLTVLIITHEMHVVKRVCGSVSLLAKGPRHRSPANWPRSLRNWTASWRGHFCPCRRRNRSRVPSRPAPCWRSSFPAKAPRSLCSRASRGISTST